MHNGRIDIKSCRREAILRAYDRLKADYFDRRIVQATLDYFFIGSTTISNLVESDGLGANRQNNESPSFKPNCKTIDCGTVERNAFDFGLAAVKAVRVPSGIQSPRVDMDNIVYKYTYPLAVKYIYSPTHIGIGSRERIGIRVVNMTVENPRQLRALAILSSGLDAIKRISDKKYQVKSQSGDFYYDVEKKYGIGWMCSCPNWQEHQTDCKHVYAVHFSMQLRLETEREINDRLLTAPTDIQCPSCGCNEVVKKGLRICGNKSNQRYKCRACGHRFVTDKELSRLKGTPEAVCVSMDLYFKGISLAKIKHHLKMFYELAVDRCTILRWIHKFSTILDEYADKHKPEVGDLWNSDEMTIGIREKGKEGRNHWIWNLMDSDTRFLLASRITKGRDVEDARIPLREGKERAGKKPKAVITDGLQSYNDAITKEMYTNTDPTIHFRTPAERKRFLNQNIERMNGTVRERTKVMRGYGGEDTAQIIQDGERFYYNHIRPHMSLDMRTPAQISNLGHVALEDDPWLTYIKMALRSRHATVEAESA